ncbi:hypothetical protein [Maridesulfovibrio ferrireducens]|uniref:hypothetical protein n=1 Tax=Maridesulfovibrio ferrireducens TaxID=246191 RepID=UPI001A2ADAB5|nr:hypothetical protein [Maridesulfovibrio ferrireducens]MBI9109981.1 hypothetical protein [Maridesulfovibrio ferrireducens]
MRTLPFLPFFANSLSEWQDIKSIKNKVFNLSKSSIFAFLPFFIRTLKKVKGSEASLSYIERTRTRLCAECFSYKQMAKRQNFLLILLKSGICLFKNGKYGSFFGKKRQKKVISGLFVFSSILGIKGKEGVYHG